MSATPPDPGSLDGQDPLPDPSDPLTGGSYWEWQDVGWFRIYHRDPRSPTASARREWGPKLRFDHHTPAPAGPDPDHRAITYLGETLGCCGAESWSLPREALICPLHHIGVLSSRGGPTVVQEMIGPPAMRVGALHNIGPGTYPREQTQAWARAIYRDRPAHPDVCGIHYQSKHQGDEALALWDTAPPSHVEIDTAILADDALRAQLIVELEECGIHFSPIAQNECKRCYEAGLIAPADYRPAP